jgi:hypothetical protein
LDVVAGLRALLARDVFLAFGVALPADRRESMGPPLFRRGPVIEIETDPTSFGD